MVLTELVAKLGFSVDDKPLEGVEHALERIRGRLEILAAAEIVRGVFELAERFAGLGESIESSAAAASLTAESFQALAFAASQNAVGQDELSGALAKLTRNLYAARTGGEHAAGAFAALGISTEEVSGFKNSREALLRVSDALGTVTDSTKKQAIVQEIFGRGSFKMIKFLNQGADQIQKIEKRGMSIGAVLGDEQVENLAEFEDAMSGLYQVFRTFGAFIGASFAPIITEMVGAFEDLWGANQKLIKTEIEVWAEKASFVFGAVTEAVRLCVEWFNGLINAHPKLIKNIGLALLAVGAFDLALALLGKVITGLLQPILTVGRYFNIMAKVGTTSWSVVIAAAGPLKSLLTAIALRMALLTETLFPALSEAILTFAAALEGMSAGAFALALGGIVAAIGAVVLGVQALWAMLHGKSFWQTWLGEGLHAIITYGEKAYGMVKRLFGFGTPAGDTPEAAAATLPGGTTGQALGAMGAATQLLGSGDLATMAQRGASGLDTLAALQVPAGAITSPTGAVMPAPMADIGQNVSLNTTINLTVPPGSDARAIADEIAKRQQQARDEMLRKAHRSMTPASAW